MAKRKNLVDIRLPIPLGQDARYYMGQLELDHDCHDTLRG